MKSPRATRGQDGTVDWFRGSNVSTPKKHDGLSGRSMRPDAKPN